MGVLVYTQQKSKKKKKNKHRGRMMLAQETKRKTSIDE